MAQAAIPTEDPPSDSRLTHHDLRVRASQLDSQIAALRAQLDKLLTDRATVQTGLDAISYPVLTLPFELTSKIFRSTLGPKDPQDPEALQRASLRLGHICRVWRQIALATRELWSSFELTVDELAPPIFDARQTLARTFLSRAAPAPLDITLYGDPDSFPTMLDIVVPYSRTWANISLDCAGSST
ncbi:hypothetical protein C8R46DRAFT_1000347 [Mycena filopes]|nr:hypothetical protein C8R46DRAFT_1000347 [Mycena filopes]